MAKAAAAAAVGSEKGAVREVGKGEGGTAVEKAELGLVKGD